MSRFDNYLQECLDINGLSQTSFSLKIGVPQSIINRIINGKISITPMIAVRLGIFFDNAPEFWMNLDSLDKITTIIDKDGFVSIKKTITGRGFLPNYKGQ